jgi:hypothetical protein
MADTTTAVTPSSSGTTAETSSTPPPTPPVVDLITVFLFAGVSPLFTFALLSSSNQQLLALFLSLLLLLLLFSVDTRWPHLRLKLRLKLLKKKIFSSNAAAAVRQQLDELERQRQLWEESRAALERRARFALRNPAELQENAKQTWSEWVAVGGELVQLEASIAQLQVGGFCRKILISEQSIVTQFDQPVFIHF